ncbi:DUF6318 family protein, partial [Actinomyces sp. B33]|uniref:DUF6318 family protein n=1 Tax=Actinomyces sp. B33 TaxID=2942131 RepID=UPI002341D289
AEYAARHFLALMEYGWATGDTQPMRDFSTDTCTPCQDMIARIDEVYSSGDWEDSAKYTVRRIIRNEVVEGYEDVPPNTYGVQMLVELPENTSYRSGKLEKNPKSLEKTSFFVTWDGSSWKVTLAANESVTEDEAKAL